MKVAKIVVSLLVICLGGCFFPFYESNTVEHITIMTWNLRGYPESQQADKDWFHNKLKEIRPDILCVQEIANQDRVDQFLNNENNFTKVAFLDSSDGQDNAIFTTSIIQVDDIIEPEGFQHPVQAAYVAYKGFDAVIITVHLSWTNVTLREQEKLLLKDAVSMMLEIDPDVIIAGDFNTKEEGIQELAESIGMIVMIPSGQDGIGTTHAGNRYDHFLVSPDLFNEEAVSCRIVTFTGDDLEYAERVSDHLPVLAFFNTGFQFRDRK